ncbi:hypothetical protein E2C01_046475 [Portunus trituberculatus]|uniref:Uncharacterized protein n=1 Tax=Portunus trituberculatus TaxID=210409 RepID=A0A5B7G5W1_PORTR|nr:hypothetical protein [Portunus trituberculatus]
MRFSRGEVVFYRLKIRSKTANVAEAQRLEKQLEVTIKRKGDIMDQVTKAYSERKESQAKSEKKRKD